MRRLMTISVSEGPATAVPSPAAVHHVRDDGAGPLRAAGRMATLIDAQAWGGLLDLFADVIEVDLASVGGRVDVVPSYVFVARLRAVLRGLASRHRLLPELATLDEDSASVTAYVRVAYPGSARNGTIPWTVAGLYRCRLGLTSQGWSVTGMTATSRWLWLGCDSRPDGA